MSNDELVKAIRIKDDPTGFTPYVAKEHECACELCALWQPEYIALCANTRCGADDRETHQRVYFLKEAQDDGDKVHIRSKEELQQLLKSADRIDEIREQMLSLVEEVRNIAANTVPGNLPCFDAYVFEQLNEHLNKSNKYNADLNDVALAIRTEARTEQE